MIAVLGVVVPLMRPLFPSRGARRADRQQRLPQPAGRGAGYHEPSLVFLAGTRTRLIDGAGAAESCARAIAASR